MDAWCIIIACGVSAFTVDTQAILPRPGKWFSQGLFTWRGAGAQASQLTDAMGKGQFSYFSFQNTKVFHAR